MTRADNSNMNHGKDKGKDKGKLKNMFRNNGKAGRKAPQWLKIRSSMRNSFPTYYETALDKFAIEMGESVRLLNTLKPTADGPPFIGDDPSVPDYSDVTEARMEENPMPLEDVVDECVELFNGMPHWSHPYTMPNVIPPANKASIIAATLTNIFSPNIIEGEYAWNVEKAEMESAAIMADLIGWDTSQAGGIYTYGGSGCYLYGMKYALTQVLGLDSRCKGVRTDGVILSSQQGHYAKMNATDWTGLGMNSIIDIETDDDTNEMDVEHLEEVLKDCQLKKIPVITVICTMGTTDAFAVDPVKKIYDLVQKYPNPEGFGKPFIYCDAVIGWSWLFFKGYNFTENPLQFDDDVLPRLESNYNRIKDVVYADAMGIDFHKTGWSTYNCSMFCMQKLNHFREMMTRPGSAYLQERTPYNPGLYTLEVSRSGSYALAGWATLRYFGLSGFRSVLGGILEIQAYLREKLKEESSMVCVNETDNGFVTLVRVYEPGVDAEVQFEREVSQPEALEELKKNNELQQKVADMMWAWFRSGKKVDGMYGAYTSYTSGFRTTDYNDDMSSDAVVYAVKAFPMNVNITADTMDALLKMLSMARKRVLAGETVTPPPHLVSPPYDAHNPAISCGGDAPTEAPRARVHDLVSGVVGSRAYTRLGRRPAGSS
eukprot:gb/GEZJ01003546.1/.p1 GENE.gb/GEZJ01003546.1/~~gb/GEZJ01003546.1/.p1  ORF type:complete len:656 (-),score=91.93 gb/GEZJ01003546.1/:172-2139(-)